MKKKANMFIMIFLFFMLFTACQDEQSEIYNEALHIEDSSASLSEDCGLSEEESNTPSALIPEKSGFFADPKDPSFNYLDSRPLPSKLFSEEPNTELSGTLTVSTSIGSQALSDWAAAFEAAYPNVKVEINAGFDSVSAAAQAEKAGGGLSAENKRKIVEIFAGTAGDIVELTTSPYQRYMESGLFLDLYEWMDQDPDFDREEYYTNIFEAWETEDGKLPVVGAVLPTVLYFNREVLDDMGIDLKEEYPQGMNYQEIIALYEQALRDGTLKDGAVLGKYLSPTSFDAFENLNYLNASLTESHFDSPEYVEYLETMKNVPTGAQPFSIASSYEPFSGRDDLVNLGGLQFSSLSELSGLTSDLNGVFQTYRLAEGGAAFRGMHMYGITSACKNPELAWEFIKFMISGKDFPEKLHLYGENDKVYRELYGGALPIHRGNLQALCSAYYQDGSVFAAVDAFMEKYTTLEFQEGELGKSLFEIYLNYYLYDLIDARECAQQLQDRAWIYFHE